MAVAKKSFGSSMPKTAAAKLKSTEKVIDIKVLVEFFITHTAVLYFIAKPDVTLSLADNDMVDLMTGKLNPQKAFFQGKLKVQGNMGLAMKLQEFQKQAGDVMKSKL